MACFLLMKVLINLSNSNFELHLGDGISFATLSFQKTIYLLLSLEDLNLLLPFHRNGLEMKFQILLYLTKPWRNVSSQMQPLFSSFKDHSFYVMFSSWIEKKIFIWYFYLTTNIFFTRIILKNFLLFSCIALKKIYNFFVFTTKHIGSKLTVKHSIHNTI